MLKLVPTYIIIYFKKKLGGERVGGGGGGGEGALPPSPTMAPTMPLVVSQLILVVESVSREIKLNPYIPC